MTESRKLVERITTLCKNLDAVRIMEVCGTHTVSLFRTGIRSLLPGQVKLVSGPGCPVCVTSQGYIDAAVEAAGRPEVTICTYGDMLRVPGRTGSLEQKRAQGARVVVCYSVRDALDYAEEHKGEEVLFLAVGFETTAPATALAVLEAEQRKIGNFSILSGHKRVMPALEALLADGDVPIDGFLLPGHVSVIIGSEVYREVLERHGKGGVVTGFEPVQILNGIARLIEQSAEGASKLENVYGVAVRPEGNRHALECMEKVFDHEDTVWRAMGTIPESGMELKPDFARFDGRSRFGIEIGEDYDPPGCRCGEVIQGKAEPEECPLFGEACTNENPVGPCMVSSEGTCAAWYRYARVRGRS